MRILIIKFRNIGDILLTTPLISNLRTHYPDAIIDIAINKETAPILNNNTELSNIISYDRARYKKLNIFSRILKEWQLIRSFRNRYDIVINLTSGDRGNYIIRLSKAPTTIGFKSDKFLFKNIFTHHLPSQEFRHTVETHLDPLRILDIPIRHKKVSVFWNENDVKKVDELLGNTKKFIHIHPVSRWLFKCINDTTFAKVIEYVHELGYEIVLTSSSDTKELQKVQDIIKLTSIKAHDFSGKLSLLEVAYLNSRSVAFIGVDTAIMHISAANDTLTLAFFGPSGAHHWGPWDNKELISGYKKINGIQHMGKHTVIAEERACQPCGRDGCEGSKISDCLMTLHIPTITKQINKLLSI